MIRYAPLALHSKKYPFFIVIITCVNNPTKEIVYYVCDCLCAEHAVQGTDEHSLVWVKLVGRAAHVVAVAHHPRDHLNL